MTKPGWGEEYLRSGSCTLGVVAVVPAGLFGHLVVEHVG
jgi:hypothetical protein